MHPGRSPLLLACLLALASCTPAPPEPAPRQAERPEAEPSPRPPPPWNEIRGSLARNQTLATALNQQGVGPAQVHQIVSALRGVYDFRRARPEAAYSLRLDTQDSLVSFRFENSPLDIVEVARDERGVLVGRRVDVPVRTVEAAIGVRIQGSLYQTLDAAGESPELAPLLVDVFAWDVDFYRDQRPGDSFRLIVEKNYRDSAFVGYGRVLAAEYSGKVAQARTFWFAPDADAKRGEYFLEDGRSARKFFLATPLQYTRVSSRFSLRRTHPVLGYTKAHLGVDYAAPRGTPVRAMASGTVTHAGRSGPNGNLVVIRHGRRLESCYAHLHRIGAGIRPGVRVKQKQVIGSVGSTGRATGPHLHFAVRQSGRYVNPQRLKLSRLDPVSSSQRPAFDRLVSQRKERLAAIALPEERTDAPLVAARARQDDDRWPNPPWMASRAEPVPLE